MKIEDELTAAAKAAGEPQDGLLIRAANEIRELRNALNDARRKQPNSAVASTSGTQGPPPS